MRLHCLGSGGYHPNERRHTACYYLPELGLVLDAGTGIFRLAEKLESMEIKVVLTHAHLDHICGLTFLLVPMLLNKIATVEIIAEKKVIDSIEAHLFEPSIFPMRPDFVMHPIQPGDEIDLGKGATLSTCPLPLHPGGSLGIKITQGEKVIAYITDTTTSDDYIPFIQNADLLLHECYFPDDNAEWCEPSGHSHTTAVAKLARKAGVKELGLIHIDPQREDDDPIGLTIAQKVFAKTKVVEDGDVFEV